MDDTLWATLLHLGVFYSWLFSSPRSLTVSGDKACMHCDLTTTDSDPIQPALFCKWAYLKNVYRDGKIAPVAIGSLCYACHNILMDNYAGSDNNDNEPLPHLPLVA